MCKTRSEKIILILLLLCVSGSLWGYAKTYRPQSYQLNAEEVRTLFADHTVTSRNLNTGTVSVSYYDPDGTVRQIRNNRQRTGQWRVDRDGKMCLQMQSNKESCRIIRLDTDNIHRKYRLTEAGLQAIVAYDDKNAFVRGDQLKWQ